MKDFIKYNVPIKNVDNLPQYPIPALKDTLERFLEWVETLVSSEELEEAKKAVDRFLSTEHSKKLEEKIKELGNREEDSWIFDYWVKSHLLVRAPLTPHTNVPIIYENKKLLQFEVLERIAILMNATASVYKDFKENGTGEYWIKNKNYSSDEFHGLLASINHIKAEMDEYYINDECSQFIVFTYKNHLYNVQVIRDGDVVSVGEILNTLKNIVSSTLEPLVPNANYVTIGVDRDAAGKVLEKILENNSNNTAYEQVKDAIMVMNYDDIEVNGVYEELDNASCNREYVNRWHGKGMQFSCTKNGIFSFIADHSFVDGGTEIYFINKLKSYIEENTFSFEELTTRTIAEEIIFDLSDDIKKVLLDLKEEFDQCMDSFQTRYVNFDGLTRERLKEKGILSGDGFIHLAFQAAQYMTYNRINNTYISVDARRYFRGRTEVNRPVSKESVHFVKEFLKKEKSSEELCELMKAALDEHHRRVKLCQSGNGVNRYLYVLESVFNDYGKEMGIHEKPELFNTKAFKAIASNHLSTTSFGHPDMKYLYFPPVQEHGFGIYYFVGVESFMIITAFEEDVEALENFIDNLQECIKGMLEL
ncbi:choline/carnitine O-acyltransferase [Oceanirhabdus sp. W0125-5]|uniref:choline/carnitine O-acyltransferase n=1 Tax=Oceanirhabdus sp. W0125-5 TaxID=2999116 RepID=UPI0022F3204B|nr:choline/carnitine O-acyltransferase [Oceanirhabdus sp. W0125-5]WBW96461.1 choline/carnitine O-acyltransferase [Oceanirhabdus sp. W0125-5]